MTTLTIASFNIEWMNKWFYNDKTKATFRPTFKKDGHVSSTDETAGRAAAVIREINPDILAVQEAPSRQKEMELFIREYLSEDGTPLYKCFHGKKGGRQHLSLLYKPDVSDSITHVPSSKLPLLSNPFLCDITGNGILEDYTFTRIPLVADVNLGDQTLRIIAVHIKSKRINKGEGIWKNEEKRPEFIREALECRRRISAEAMRLRYYINMLLAKDEKARALVLGDLNDGPGMDYFEEKYLTHNLTDILIGSAFVPEWIFAHAQHDMDKKERYTAVFDDFVTGEKDKHLLLDHILLSPGLCAGDGPCRVRGSGKIHHQEYNNNVVAGGKYRENRPSDHRPVSIRLEF